MYGGFMNINDLQCTVNVSTDWRIILDVKNKFSNGWEFVREDYITNDRVALVFQRIYIVPKNVSLGMYEYRQKEDLE